FVSHGHVLVNGKKVDIPSYEIRVGDVVEVREKSRASRHVKEMLEATESGLLPSWLSLDNARFKGEVTALPPREDIDFEVQEHLIIELFSK
ncbi:MAG: ribosomal protein uS4 family protein, partial [Oscillospiraceae bacterium]